MEKIIRELRNFDLAGLVADMIRIPSFSFMEEQEKEIALYIKDFFSREEIPCELTEIAPGRYNVQALLKGRGAGRGLMLCGHLDTVPPYDMPDAFSGRIEGGIAYGRGACDMKGALAAMMVTLAAIKRSGVQMAGDLYFCGVADEEEKGLGAAHVVQHGPHTQGVIVGEPTSLHISPGHKGLEWIRAEFKGKKVHGGRQAEGVNAIEMAARFIERVYERYVPLLNSRDYPLLGPPTINIGTISGGDQPSTVPDRCELTLDRRMVPTESIEQVYAELRELAASLHEEDPRFSCRISDMFEGEGTLAHLPFVTAEEDPLVDALKTSCTERGEDVCIEPFPAWTDAGFIAAGSKSKCVVFGPGELGKAHSAHEAIELWQVGRAAEIYSLCALKYCGRHDGEQL